MTTNHATEPPAPESRVADETAPEVPGIDVVVVGASLPGLVAARDLARRGYRVTVLEAGSGVGGTVRSKPLGDATISAGPHGIVDSSGTLAELAEELGLELVRRSSARDAYRLAGRTVPMPVNTVLGIPATPLASDVAAVIGWSGALRAYVDRLRPVLKIGRYSSLGRLVRSRMGAAVAERMLAPVARARFGASPHELTVAETLPQLNNEITRAGSLSGGIGALAASIEADAALSEVDIVGGLEVLAEALAADARDYHAEIRLGSTIDIAARDDAGLLLTLTDGDELRAQAIIYAPDGIYVADGVALRVSAANLSGSERFDTVFTADGAGVGGATHVADLGARFGFRAPGDDTVLFVGLELSDNMPEAECVAVATAAAESLLGHEIRVLDAAVFRREQPVPVPAAGAGIRVITAHSSLSAALEAARQTASAVQRADFAVPGTAWSDDINQAASDQEDEA